MHNSINFTWSRLKYLIYKKPINVEFRLHYRLCIFFLNFNNSMPNLGHYSHLTSNNKMPSICILLNQNKPRKTGNVRTLRRVRPTNVAVKKQ